MTRTLSIGPLKMAGVGLGAMLFIYALLALLFGACWQYAINTGLDFAGKSENYIGFGTAYIIGLIPWVNGFGIIAALLAFASTFIVPLFL